ncbi:hypothetical protein BV22DRAFT_1026874 [Leucogyrophana mollusca]|uniref:Uncharacterized protein n=1 Tax=Leucogyrophana mollusca TaxID=85980 RepID=A0ACB8AVA1_9AGAM|nr:hypothetical protein BV22DRAFT_1026874 [Leucogyrophana mollusca]
MHHSGKRVEWEAGREWLAARKLICFTSGLTPFQFLNNLVNAGILYPPSVEQSGSWIGQHRRLGAFDGLARIGFKVDCRPVHWAEASFKTFYAHLDRYLSPEDKEMLVFDTVFTEHLLCKVARYSKAFCEGDKITLDSLGRQAILQEASMPWISGENLEDATGKLFPIPLHTDKESLKRIVEQAISVSTESQCLGRISSLTPNKGIVTGASPWSIIILIAPCTIITFPPSSPA